MAGCLSEMLGGTAPHDYQVQEPLVSEEGVQVGYVIICLSCGDCRVVKPL